MRILSGKKFTMIRVNVFSIKCGEIRDAFNKKLKTKLPCVKFICTKIPEDEAGDDCVLDIGLTSKITHKVFK